MQFGPNIWSQPKLFGVHKPPIGPPTQPHTPTVTEHRFINPLTHGKAPEYGRLHHQDFRPFLQFDIQRS